MLLILLKKDTKHVDGIGLTLHNRTVNAYQPILCDPVHREGNSKLVKTVVGAKAASVEAKTARVEAKTPGVGSRT